MFWGCFGATASGPLILTKKRIDGSEYCRILGQALEEANDLQRMTLLQDNAPPHTAKRTKAWLRAHNIRVLFAPPRSPDLNPVEEIWGTLSQRVFSHIGVYPSLETLLSKVAVEWEKLLSSNTFRESMADSMHRRCEQVVELRGGFPTGKKP